ncbi:hypothetical protein [Thermus sp.]|uniref:hypothetical protein n=1 Tax=Thermus sp. TaxID=275 RepID=UPI0039A5E383
MRRTVWLWLFLGLALAQKPQYSSALGARGACTLAWDTIPENAMRSRGGRIPYHEGAVRYFRERGVWR